MQKLTLYMQPTIDGFISGPNGEFDDFEPAPDTHQFANDLFSSVDGVIFGRTTYEGFTGYWDTIDLTPTEGRELEVEFAKIFRSLKRVVFSRTLTEVAANTTLICDNPFEQLTAIKQQPGRGYLLVCGPELLSTLISHNLVDEIKLSVMPKVIGRGKALFGQIQTKPKLKLLSLQKFESGTILEHYSLRE